MKPGSRLWPFGPLILTVVLAVAARLLLSPVLTRSSPARVWYKSGVEASRSGDFPGAVADLQRATSLDGKFAPALDLLAGAYLKVGNAEKALETLQQLETLDPDQSYVSARIAETYAGTDNALTERWATLAVIQRPRSPRAQMLMAVALAREGTTKDALSHALTAESLSGNRALALLVRKDPSLSQDPRRESLLFLDLVPQMPYE